MMLSKGKSACVTFPLLQVFNLQARLAQCSFLQNEQWKHQRADDAYRGRKFGESETFEANYQTLDSREKEGKKECHTFDLDSREKEGKKECHSFAFSLEIQGIRGCGSEYFGESNTNSWAATFLNTWARSPLDQNHLVSSLKKCSVQLHTLAIGGQHI